MVLHQPCCTAQRERIEMADIVTTRDGIVAFFILQTEVDMDTTAT